MLDKIRKPIEKQLNQLELRFRAIVETDVMLIKEIFTHIVSTKGKRLRPILLFLCSNLYGKSTEKTLEAATIVELLHTATLIHDDVVDNSDMRRGAPSVNSIWENKISVLIGDYLFAEVLYNLTKLDDPKMLDIIGAVCCLRANKIKVKTYNMIGIPGETIEQALQTLQLNIDLKPTWARCAIISPYPNTALWKENPVYGQMRDNYIDESLYAGKEFVNLQRFFAVVVVMPWLLPLVKVLIKLPRNIVFDKLGRLFFGYYASKYWGYSFRDVVKYGIEFLKTGQPI